VDSDIVPPNNPAVVRSLKQQIEEDFLPTYGQKPEYAFWSGSDSLFAIFIGINDVSSSYELQDATINSAVFKVYYELIYQVCPRPSSNKVYFT
jgi:hypothetical protein